MLEQQVDRRVLSSQLITERQQSNSEGQYVSDENIQNSQHEAQNLIEDNNPFIIEKYTKQDRERERSNRPKLGLRRLTDDKKLASIDIDIPYGQNTVIKQKFDWDLNKDKISPSDFAKQLVTALNLAPQYIQKLKQQILGQIMQHIKTNTRQKPIQQQHISQPQISTLQQQQLYPRPFAQTIRFNNNEYPQQQFGDKQQNQKKKMSRMRRKQLQRSTNINSTQPNRYFKQKKICKNCKNQNVTPGFQCKNCKVPFQLMQVINMDDRRVKISVKYYQKIANKIPLLVYEAKKRNFQKQDFDSFYMIYNKIRSIFQTSDELSKQNLNQVKYIMEKYHEYFLNGQLDFNDEQIIYEKDAKKDQKEDENRPKRQRGRPRKIKIINDDLQPDSLNSDEDDDSSGSQQSYYQSDSQ